MDSEMYEGDWQEMVKPMSDEEKAEYDAYYADLDAETLAEREAYEAWLLRMEEFQNGEHSLGYLASLSLKIGDVYVVDVAAPGYGKIAYDIVRIDPVTGEVFGKIRWDNSGIQEPSWL